MAQVPIREFDAKHMFSGYMRSTYPGVLIRSVDDMGVFCDSQSGSPDARWVIKPDQLFGKRGKYGLIGVKLSIAGVRDWFERHFRERRTIGKQEGILDTFLIEPFVPHTEEYYIAIKTERDHDVIYFSHEGGIEVEEHWESVREMRVSVSGALEPTDIETSLTITDMRIVTLVQSLYRFFVEYGFAYLEVNPFTWDAHAHPVCLDMVARVDDSESYRQKSHWKNLEFPHPFGPEKTQGEQYIERLDSETGASLKYRILNPDGSIWLLTSGGGASVIIADTIADRGLATEIGNYGECSGNPDRESTAAYTGVLLQDLLGSQSPHTKYLIIAGAIANFTHIDRTFAGVIDALTLHQEALRAQDIEILVRRGGINDVAGLQMMQVACQELGLTCRIADGNTYMTDILSHIIH